MASTLARAREMLMKAPRVGSVTLGRAGAGGLRDSMRELVLSNPGRRNALSPSMMLELYDAVAALNADDRATVVILRGGTGERGAMMRI